MHKELVGVALQLPDMKGVKDVTNEQLSEAMAPEVTKFEEWFKGQGNEPLIGHERSIVRTYLAWKLKFEG